MAPADLLVRDAGPGHRAAANHQLHGDREQHNTHNAAETVSRGEQQRGSKTVPSACQTETTYNK
jgi:hypothetical protein